MQIVKQLAKDSPIDAEMLREAFTKFTETSEKLQINYDALRKEATDLRTKLAQKELEVKRAEQLATLGKTAAALAHEIRNPLGAITLYVSLLRDDLAQSPEQLELVNAIGRSAESLNYVVTNILQFAKSKPPTMAPVNLFSLCQEVGGEIAKSYQGITFTPLLEGTPFLLGDAHALRQVLHNLFRNACQAMSGNGEIRCAVLGNEKWCILKVRDTGPGIPAEVRESLFEPFVTTKNEGTGLGLAVVDQIVKQHKGSIRIDNLSSGAEIEILFPCARKGASKEMVGPQGLE
ncbi:MAG: GHKL domain-containing protein [Bdellovibrionales bacterium]|nr:GHKL domain-containing protein [Bdellovibrionales bacterium]